MTNLNLPIAILVGTIIYYVALHFFVKRKLQKEKEERENVIGGTQVIESIEFEEIAKSQSPETLGTVESLSDLNRKREIAKEPEIESQMKTAKDFKDYKESNEVEVERETEKELQEQLQEKSHNQTLAETTNNLNELTSMYDIEMTH